MAATLLISETLLAKLVEAIPTPNLPAGAALTLPPGLAPSLEDLGDGTVRLRLSLDGATVKVGPAPIPLDGAFISLRLGRAAGLTTVSELKVRPPPMLAALVKPSQLEHGLRPALEGLVARLNEAERELEVGQDLPDHVFAAEGWLGLGEPRRVRREAEDAMVLAVDAATTARLAAWGRGRRWPIDQKLSMLSFGAGFSGRVELDGLSVRYKRRRAVLVLVLRLRKLRVGFKGLGRMKLVKVKSGRGAARLEIVPTIGAEGEVILQPGRLRGVALELPALPGRLSLSDVESLIGRLVTGVISPALPDIRLARLPRIGPLPPLDARSLAVEDRVLVLRASVASGG